MEPEDPVCMCAQVTFVHVCAPWPLAVYNVLTVIGLPLQHLGNAFYKTKGSESVDVYMAMIWSLSQNKNS